MPDVDQEKLPWLQFWVTSWQSDKGLAMCSLAARGLWIEMLCLMHHSTPYGTLTDHNGKPMGCPELSSLVRADTKSVEEMLAELDGRKVFSRDVEGRIFSRRMQRDHHLRTVRAAAGSKGGKRSGKSRKKG